MEKAKKSNCRGFTIIEVVIAIGVLTICSLIAYPTFISYMDLSRQNIEENIAAFDLETCLEDLKSSPFMDIKTTYADGDNIIKYNDLHLQDERVRIYYIGSTIDPLYIRLEVTWTDFQRNSQTREFITALTK